MICDVCGRDNADNLTFCQDCGRRMKSKESRGVPPTPPTGVPAVELPRMQSPPPGGMDRETSGAPIAPETDPPPRNSSPGIASQPPAPTRSRPEAPVFSFRQALAPAARPVQNAPPSPLPAPLPPEPVMQEAPGCTCTNCQAENPVGYRFCVACGAPLRAAAAPGEAIGGLPYIEPPRVSPGVERGLEWSPPVAQPSTVVGAGSPPQRPSSPGMMAQATGPGATQPLEDKIVGARVVDIASTKNLPVRLILCARCQGQCVAGTRFCKYCGASLEERSSTPPRLASGPEGAPFEPVLAAPQAGAQAPASPDGSGGPRMDLADRMVGLNPAPPDLLPRPAPTSPGHDAPVRPPEVRPDLRLQPQASAPSPVPLPHPGLPPIRAPQKPPVSVPGREPPRAVAAQSDPAPRPSPEPKHDGGAAPAGRASAASASRGRRLVVIVEDGTEGRSYPLLEQQIDIGRYEGHIRLPDDPYVSPRHARLLDVDGRWILRDLDSTNRVYVRIRKPHPLRDADLLLLGLEVLQFHSVTDGERGLGHAKEHGTLVFGSPASPRRARLAQRTVEGITRDVYHLFRDETVIGREIGDIVFTADPFLSRRHAAIRRNPTTDEFSIIDLDSSNGSYIAIREDVTVHNGDFVRIGQHLFRVDLA